MENEKIMNKIMALLNKTVENGATEQEAIAAGLMAQRLMKKYKISEVVDTTKPKEVIRNDVKIKTKTWITSLAGVIGDNFCCKVIRTRAINVITRKPDFIIEFYGYEQDVKVATKMFNTLCKIIDKGVVKQKALAKRKYGTSKGVQNAYTLSFIRAVDKALSEQCKALQLVISNQVVAKVNELYPDIKDGSIKFKIEYYSEAAISDARKQGEIDGREATERRKLK